MTTSLAADVEAAVLARAGRRRGQEIRFRCPTHPDEHPSADYNPARGVWICRSCGAGGGVQDLARRVGLRTGPRSFARPRRLSPEEEVLRQEQRNRARLAQAAPLFRLADEIKAHRDSARVVRGLAATAAADGDAMWDLVFAAADLEREADRLEAEADALLRAMR